MKNLLSVLIVLMLLVSVNTCCTKEKKCCESSKCCKEQKSDSISETPVGDKTIESIK